MKTWATLYEKCINCNSIDSYHFGRGFCRVCYFKVYLKQRRKEDSEYHKKRCLQSKINSIKSRVKNPVQAHAYSVILVARKKGLIKIQKCFCGEKKVEAHHEDYSKPLDIIFLCKKHHMEADRVRRNRIQKI